ALPAVLREAVSTAGHCRCNRGAGEGNSGRLAGAASATAVCRLPGLAQSPPATQAEPGHRGPEENHRARLRCRGDCDVVEEKEGWVITKTECQRSRRTRCQQVEQGGFRVSGRGHIGLVENHRSIPDHLKLAWDTTIRLKEKPKIVARTRRGGETL